MTADPTTLPTWHEGERFIQAKLGVAERMEAMGQRVVRDHMPDQHRAFFEQLPFLVLGSVDASGDPWATIVEGRPGFITAPTPKLLEIAAQPDPADPASAGLAPGRPVGLLGMELHTRRRNRMNGVVGNAERGFRVEVDQSFGNCPRYIQLRDVGDAGEHPAPAAAAIEVLDGLDASARAMIEAADTFFVASYAERPGRRQLDVSHRGGRAGFVRVAPDGVLTVPDFDGNLFFNTLGNILLNGRAGLLFVDGATGTVLQMTGEAEITFDSPEIAAFQGAERLWTVRPRRILRRRGALALRWTMRDDPWSPSSLMTGDWRQAEQRLRAAELADRWRPFTVTAIVDESTSIRSFHLQPVDGAGLSPHQAGQHLPIRVTLPGADAPVIRTYTLSTAPSDGAYRISVKRDGRISGHLHDTLRVGDTIEARAPAGAFTIDARETRPAILLAGGVGITPMLAMLRQIVYDGVRTQRVRPTILIHAARTLAERPFDAELRQLVDAAFGAVTVIRLLSDPRGATQGTEYDVAGRIDTALLSRVLPPGEYDAYLCGPAGFTQALYDGLRALGAADAWIHAEAFGPSSLVRTGQGAAMARMPPASTRPVPVVFTESAKEARWQPGSGTLLELAEARGLQPDYSCREGTCGTCKSKILRGAVTYVRPPGVVLAEDEVLICSAVPAAQDAGEEEPIHLAL